MKIGCVMMQKDEVNALEPWLLYHAHLFGLNNLCVIDHGSTHPKVIEALNWYEEDGLNVVRLPASADYKQKGVFVTEQLKALAAIKEYDFLLPADCDEFLALRKPDGHFTCDKSKIFEEFQLYAGRSETFEIRQNLLNILGRPGRFWLFPYQKVFFSAEHLGVVDHGSHMDVSGRGAETLGTSLIFLHFHHKSWAEHQKSGLRKLGAFVDVNNPAALAAFQGPGVHLLVQLNEGEANYNQLMVAGPPDHEVQGLLELFGNLGIDPLFFEYSAN